jgi:hypothetical protein
MARSPTKPTTTMLAISPDGNHFWLNEPHNGFCIIAEGALHIPENRLRSRCTVVAVKEGEPADRFELTPRRSEVAQAADSWDHATMAHRWALAAVAEMEKRLDGRAGLAM